MTYSQLEYLLTSTQLCLVMLGMGATLAPGDFRAVITQPRSFVVGLLCQFVLTPIVAATSAILFDVPPGIAVGLMLVAVMPGGSFSNMVTYLGRGNVALSVALTAVATLLSLVIVPFELPLLAGKFIPDEFEMPVGYILRDVIFFVVVPLAVGMAVGRPMNLRMRAGFSKYCVGAGMAVTASIIVLSLGSGRIHPAQYGWGPPLVVIFFCVVTQQLAMVPFRIWSWPSQDRFAVGVEVTIRNVNLALMLRTSLFPEDDAIAAGALFVTLFYGATAIVAAIPPIFIHRRVLRRAERRRNRILSEERKLAAVMATKPLSAESAGETEKFEGSDRPSGPERPAKAM